jgi:hypothetical protein
MLRDVLWKLGALAFALAAPVATVLVALAWARGSGPLMVIRAPLLMRGASLAFALVVAAAALFVWTRSGKMHGLEAFLLWLGCALSFALTFGTVSDVYQLFFAPPLGAGPYFWGGVVWGFALAATIGVALAAWWRRCCST